MSFLQDPHWIGFDGNPITGKVPHELRVYDQPLSPEQAGAVAHAYRLFCGAKLTMVGQYLVQNRLFQDGTRVRMVSIQGRDTVMVWPGGGGEPWVKYQTCLAYLFFTSPTGRTIRRKDGVWAVWHDPDPRAVENQKFYGRIGSNLGDATLYDANALHYKGCGFTLAGPTYRAAAVLGDKTPADIISSHTSGNVYAVKEDGFVGDGNKVTVCRGKLPTPAKWEKFENYDDAYPDVTMSSVFQVPGISPINFCYDRPYVLVQHYISPNPGNTIIAYRLTPEVVGNTTFPAGSVVASADEVASFTVSLAPDISVVWSFGPYFAAPWADYGGSGEYVDGGGATHTWYFEESRASQNGADVTLSVSKTIANPMRISATDNATFNSCKNGAFFAVEGEVRSTVSATTVIHGSEFSSELHARDEWMLEGSLIEADARSSFYFMRFDEETNISLTTAFVGKLGGVDYTLTDTEEIARSCSGGQALYPTSVTAGDHGPEFGPIVAAEGMFITSYRRMWDESWNISRNDATCAFADARFGAVVVIEQRHDYNGTRLQNQDFAAPRDLDPGAYLSAPYGAVESDPSSGGEYGYLWGNYAQHILTGSGATVAATHRYRKSLVLFHGGVEVYRHVFYDKTDTEIPTYDVDLLDFKIRQPNVSGAGSVNSKNIALGTSSLQAVANRAGIIARLKYKDESNVDRQLIIDGTGHNWKVESGDTTSHSVTANIKMFRL